MIVVADSGPPHYLILIEQIELLRRFYGKVVIPDAVANELRAAGSPSTVRNWIAHLPEWVVVTPVPQEEIESITDDLDLGERSAIALAGTIHADLLLIDDAAGRAEATRRSLRVTGTLGVLRAAAEQGIVDVPDMLSKLKATSFYVDDDLINAIFDRWLLPR
jgi:predicted nucleic acid-binding protein